MYLAMGLFVAWMLAVLLRAITYERPDETAEPNEVQVIGLVFECGEPAWLVVEADGGVELVTERVLHGGYEVN